MNLISLFPYYHVSNLISAYGYVDGPSVGASAVARLGIIKYLTLDGSGNIYMSDSYYDAISTATIPTDTVRRYDINTGDVITIAGKNEGMCVCACVCVCVCACVLVCACVCVRNGVFV